MSERNYKAEYKKFQSSTKAKKYRAELNQYNRKKGTYGNGDGKDASHKGGRIAGFEAESKNRGRAEKSRLKKEAITMLEAKFTDDTLVSRIKHWSKQHKGTGIGYGHVLGQLAVHMKEMGWNKSYKEVARIAVELGKKKKVESVKEGGPGSGPKPENGSSKDKSKKDAAKSKAKEKDLEDDAMKQAFKDMEDEFGDLEEGTKAFLAYREMKEALNVAIYGIKKIRKFIDDAPYNPKFNMITKELYKWEIELEKKWRRVVPQISKISKDKMLESVNERWNPNKIKSHSAKAINFLKQAQQFAKQGQKGAVWNRLKDAGWELKQVMAFTESVNEGKKRYYQQDRVGSAKYTISYHDGKKKHKDGSDFFDIKIFRNKKDLAKFVNTLSKSGYVYGFNESVNEAERKMSSLEMQQIILLAKAMKQLPGSPAQKKIKKQINVIRKKLGQAPVKESVNEAKANIYGIEFRKSPKDRKFKKASLTISSTQGLRAHRNMTMAILKKAEKLKKQSKWAEYRITVNGQPYMMGLGAKRITRFPRPKINDNIDIDEGFYDGTKKFEKNRKKNAEQLGYKVTGISDIKTDLQSTINEDDVVEEECCDNCHEGKECCSVHEAKETGIDVAKRVLKNKQYEKGAGWALDLTTAGFIMKIYNAYKSHPNLQRQMKNLPVKKMVNLAYKVMK